HHIVGFLGLALLAVALLFVAAPANAQAAADCRAASSPPTGFEPARPLNEHGLQNLVAFTRLLGFVRHFTASGDAAKADWDTLAIDGVRQIEPCEGPAQLAAALEGFFRPLAPTILVFPNGTSPPSPEGLTPPAEVKDLHITSWQHQGAGQVAN